MKYGWSVGRSRRARSGGGWLDHHWKCPSDHTPVAELSIPTDQAANPAGRQAGRPPTDQTTNLVKWISLRFSKDDTSIREPWKVSFCVKSDHHRVARGLSEGPRGFEKPTLGPSALRSIDRVRHCFVDVKLLVAGSLVSSESRQMRKQRKVASTH